MYSLPITLGTLGLLGLSLLLPACSGSDSASAGSGAEVGGEVSEGELDRDIRDLISAVSPLGPNATAAAERDWYARRKETLERLRKGPSALGEKALEAYAKRPDALPALRSALLDVAAHCSPESTRTVLVDLVTTFGDNLGLRKNAAEFLALTSPKEALRVLEPILSTTELSSTYPPADELFDYWLAAMKTLDRDPVPLLAEAATDIRRDAGTRNYTIKKLGGYPSKLGRMALEQVLVESIGNQMARRFAAQSLRKTVDTEDLCPVLQRVFDNEADTGFQQFLASMLEESCY